MPYQVSYFEPARLPNHASKHFYLHDESSCCFSIKIEKKIPRQVFFPAFEASKSDKSGWVQYRARRETGDSKDVTSYKNAQSCDFSFPQMFFVCKGSKRCGRKYEWDC